jgi:nucleoside 2-deoxyribosyltransferase
LKKISCFVACAFGKEDVDEIYQNAILPLLESMEIKPYRVDQIEHNDDIDNKIIELILKCDICIADLTYSRPSVYYEAGYFTGLRKPVIFVTRKDHFSPKTEDFYGNFKIHFDLQMKNIITWSSTKRVDTFKRKLLSRIKFVSNPLIQRIKKGAIQEKSRLNFSKLSQKDKQLEIETQLLKFFKKKSSIVNRMILDYKDVKAIEKSSLKNFDRSKKYMFSFITLSATKEYMKSVDRINYGQIGYLEPFKSVNRNILITSIRKVPRSRLEDMYPVAKPIADGKVLEFIRPNNLKIRYLFISNIKSIEEFKKELEIISQEVI